MALSSDVVRIVFDYEQDGASLLVALQSLWPELLGAPPPWRPLTDSDWQKIALYAAKHDLLEDFEWALAACHRPLWLRWIEQASTSGSAAIVRLGVDRFKCPSRGWRFVAKASAGGHFELVDWLMSNLPRASRCSMKQRQAVAVANYIASGWRHADVEMKPRQLLERWTGVYDCDSSLGQEIMRYIVPSICYALGLRGDVAVIRKWQIWPRSIWI